MANLAIKEDDFLAPVINDDITNVAVDNGYADQKIAYWAKDAAGSPCIQEILIPSRAQMGAININIDGEATGVYDIDGDAWTVGSDVTEPETIRGERYAYSELNSVLVAHSLLTAGFSGKNVRVATGLPFDHFFKEGAKNTALIDKVKSSLQVEVTPRGKLPSALISAHDVYPESTAAFVDYAVDSVTGEMKTDFENGFAVVDIGGNTTDVTYINPDNTINTTRSGSRNLGVLNVRDRLAQMIKNDFNIDELRDSQVEMALRKGTCRIFGKEENISSQIEKAKRQVVKKLMNYVNEVLGDGADLDMILFVGGGAEVLGDVIQEYPHAHVPDRPQFANARGMLKYMTFVG